MKQIVFFFLVFLQLGYLPLFAQKTILDEHAQMRTTGAFNAIHVSSAFDVFLSQSAEHAVVVSASDVSTRDQIITEVKGGTLYISLKKSNFDWKGSRKLRAYISAPDLNKIELSGSTDLTIENTFKADDLDVRLSGSSDFKGNVVCKNLKVSSSGSSDYRMSGTTENLKVNLSGSSDMKSFGLSADYCDINCSGTSDVEITVNKELKVNLSGASDVNYKGQAIVREMKTSGSSSVKKRD
jgi:hypothetical protein